MTDHLAHFGIKRKSGRYPWGSGERPYQGDSSSFSKKSSVRVKSFSDDELQDAIKRLRMEKEYLQLEESVISSDKNDVEKFNKFLNTTSAALKVGTGAISLINATKKLSKTFSDKEH